MALTKIIRRWYEWAFGHWYEGPTTPLRLVKEPRLWARLYPQATRREWIEMCEAMARTAYEAGYMRGFENAEREPGGPSPLPDQIADAMDPSWRDVSFFEGLDILAPDDVPCEYEHTADTAAWPFVDMQRIKRRDGLPLR